MKKQKSFTLIEVLVVAAIIGLLASIILVSIKEVRERAKIAKGLNFAAQVHHVLGAYAVGIWDFDDQTLNDTSGNENHGSCTNCPTSTTDTPSDKGYALYFDGVNDYVDVGSDPSLEFDNKVTVSVWVKWDNLGGWRSIIHGTATGGWISSYWLATSSATNMRWSINGDNAHDFNPGDLQTDKWYHIVGTYDGSTARVYINGIEKTSFSKSGNINNENGVSIGLTGSGEYRFNGTIDDVHIHEESLSLAQIKKLYVEGLERHKLAEK